MHSILQVHLSLFWLPVLGTNNCEEDEELEGTAAVGPHDGRVVYDQSRCIGAAPWSSFPADRIATHRVGSDRFPVRMLAASSE